MGELAAGSIETALLGDCFEFRKVRTEWSDNVDWFGKKLSHPIVFTLKLRIPNIWLKPGSDPRQSEE